MQSSVFLTVSGEYAVCAHGFLCAGGFCHGEAYIDPCGRCVGGMKGETGCLAGDDGTTDYLDGPHPVRIPYDLVRFAPSVIVAGIAPFTPLGAVSRVLLAIIYSRTPVAMGNCCTCRIKHVREISLRMFLGWIRVLASKNR